MNSVPGDIEMPLEEHLKELRSRMLIVAIPVIIITVIVFIFSGKLLKIIWTHAIPAAMTIYSPMELIITRITISFIFSLFIGIPLIVYESFLFVGKGLYPEEKNFFIKILPFSFIMFTAGALVAYFLFVPFLFKETIVYSLNVADPQISVIKTINTIIMLVLGFGLIFQFPLIILSSIKIGLIKKDFFKTKRKFIYLAILGIAASAIFISPDPSSISELIIAVILIILFEFSLLIARFF